MSDNVVPELEPYGAHPSFGPDPDAVGDEIAALTDLTQTGLEIDRQVQLAEGTWVIYGHTTYDGELILGEYHDAAEASEVLRAARGPRPDLDRLAQ